MALHARCVYLTFVSVAFFSVGSQSQGKPEHKLHFFVSTVPQEGAPVTVVGLKMPSKIAGSPTVVFRNASGKAIERITFAAAIANASSLRTGDLHLGSDIRFVVPVAEKLSVKPGKLGEFHLLPFSNSYVTSAAQLGSACLRVAPLLQQVTFGDGTRWQSSFDDLIQQWRQESSHDEPLDCETSPGPAANVSGLRSSKFNGAGGSTRAGQHLVSKYSFQCSWRDDEQAATCPF